MNIPRKNTEAVKEILSTNQTNSEKAIKIHDFDYDCHLRANSKGINRWELMSPAAIEKELNGAI